jgi:hypothetical protein
MSRLSAIRALLAIAAITGASASEAQTAGASNQTVYPIGQYPSPYASPNYWTTNVPVTASVGTRCSFLTGNAPSGSVNAPNLDVNGFDRSINFKLDCTGPSRVGVVSLYGGLLNGGAVPLGYANTAPYDVQLNLVGNSTSATSACAAAELLGSNLSATCTATYLTGGNNIAGPSSATKGLLVSGVATNGATSTIRVMANPYAGSAILTAGTYNDTLTITVSTAP